MAVLVALVVIVASFALFFQDDPSKDRETIYQVSTIDALMAGLYDGVVSIDELNDHGDTGLGTFDALDGEMVMLDGVCYQVLSDGHVEVASRKGTTPFAVVTFFDEDSSTDLVDVGNFSELLSAIGSELETENMVSVIVLEGTFSYVKARSVPAQQPPYLPLEEVIVEQTIFEFENVSGTIVGFYTPEYMAGMNVAGFHLHFISSDLSMGGHLLDVSFETAELGLDLTPSCLLFTPGTDAFLDLEGGGGDIDKVEH
jgi:acetolactate decarboxylase